MKDFCVGAAKNEITPALGCLLYGYPVERHAERVLDKLSIGAIAIRQNAKILLLISAEICSISKETCDGLRKTVSDAVGVGAESVFFLLPIPIPVPSHVRLQDGAMRMKHTSRIF